MGRALRWLASHGSPAADSAMVVSLTIMSVATPLGWMVLTRIECSANSSAQICISATRPRFEAA